jgi:3-dehydroquinate dehydratase/shikimate dehydrogenase
VICVSVMAPTLEAMRTKVRAAADLADVIELRLDSLPPDAWDLKALLSERPRPVIVTCRAASEGGLYRGPEPARHAVLQQAIDLGASYVDVELSCVGALRRAAGTKLIVSVHNLQETPPDLPRLHHDLLAAGADIVKIATTARSLTDNLRIFELLVSAHAPTIALCMGELGRISRILGRKFGAVLTYGALAPGEETAPGQVPAIDLRDLYRYRTITSETQVFGVIGKPVAHSLSPAIHNAAFDRLGLNAVYVPFLVDEVGPFIQAFREIEVKGYSVTLPHKEAALLACDVVDPAAQRIGAVNTVVARNGQLHGYNCDYIAALRCLERALGAKRARKRSPLAGRRVALVGAGGVARTIAFAVADRGGLVTVFNRTLDRAERLAADVARGTLAAPLADLSGAHYDVLVNATPVGMTPNVDASPVPTDALQPGAVVFDTIYTPLETRLIREARARGCTAVTGLEMFVDQAAAQCALFTGQKAPVALMRHSVLARLPSGG